MRINDRSVQDTLQAGIQNNRAMLADLQEQITSGERIKRPSQDPAGFRQKSRIEKTVSQMEQDRRLMSDSSSFLGRTDQALEQLTSNVRKLRNIVLERGNDSRGLNVSSTLAIETDRLVESNVLTLNADVSGTYLFGGHKSKTEPFKITRGASGMIDNVQYQGDQGYPPLSLPGGEQLKVPINGETIVNGSGDDLMALGLDIRKAMDDPNFDTDGFLNRLQKVEDNLVLRRSQAGSAMSHLEQLDGYMADQLITLRKEYQDVAGTDLTEAITQSLATETNLQVSMQIAARSSQLSLVNYLR